MAVLVASDAYCGLISDETGPFKACRDNTDIDMSTAYDTCEYDVCAYQEVLEEAKKLACAHLEGLASDCNNRGYPVANWRDISNCGRS